MCGKSKLLLRPKSIRFSLILLLAFLNTLVNGGEDTGSNEQISSEPVKDRAGEIFGIRCNSIENTMQTIIESHDSNGNPIASVGENGLERIDSIASSTESNPASPEYERELPSVKSYCGLTPKSVKSMLGLKSARKDKKKKKKKKRLSPVILLPGYGGSRLESKVNKPRVVKPICHKKSDWFDIWVSIHLLLPLRVDCWVDDLRLIFDRATNTTSSPPGVQVRVKNSDKLSSIEELHSLPVPITYYSPVIDYLVDKLDYEREVSIRAAPYDFRKAPNELGEYFEHLKVMSEQMFQENHRKRITYICHSLGCKMILYFLHHQSQQWKNTFVKRLISLTAPWAGSMSAIRAVTLGDDFGAKHIVKKSKTVHVLRSPATVFLFPHTRAYSDKPLVKLNAPVRYISSGSGTKSSTNEFETKQYAANDMKLFFDDINYPDGYQMWLNTKDLLGSMKAPGVELYCIAGKGEKTLDMMEFHGKFSSSHYKESYSEGDGTVGLNSASYCKKWYRKQRQPVHYREFHTSHMEVLGDVHVLEYIDKILNSRGWFASPKARNPTTKSAIS